MAADRPVTRMRPVYLNLVAIRLPLPGIVSILHRISGAALFLFGIPLLLLALQTSLGSPEGYASIAAWLGNPLVKIVVLLLAAGYLYHLLAGIRHLVLDTQVGLDLPTARQSAALILIVSIVLTIAVGVRLW
jgi:succinate dehydrogenase / fumarate reductase, cytochrome b subunit